MRRIISFFVALHFIFIFQSSLVALAEDFPDEDPNPQDQEEELPEEEIEDQDAPEEDEVEEDIEEDEEEEFEPESVWINEVLPDPVELDSENEFIELYNSGDTPVDLSGWRLDDEDLDDEDFYLFDNPELNYVVEPGGYLTLFRPETDIVLNNDGDTVYLFNTLEEEVDFYTYEPASAGRSWGRNPELIEEWLLYPVPSPDAENIFFNEAPVAVITIQGGSEGMKVNVTGEDSYDPDGDALAFEWEFEPNVFDQKKNPLTYEYSTPGNKTIRLTVTDEFGLSHETTIPFVAALPNAEQSDVEEDVPPIEDEENLPDQTYDKHVLIHEILPDPAGPDTGAEWIELYNSTGKSIDLSGWYLDDEEGASSPFQFPENTILETGEFMVFKGSALNLSLKNSEDVVRLLDPNKDEVERVAYFGSQENQSYAKDETKAFFWTSLLTPGAMNDFPPPPQSYQLGDVLFDSVLPDPEGPDTGKEKILLKNTLSEAIDLSYWTLADGTGQSELMGISLPPKGTQELTSEDFGLSLNNSNESLTLFDPSGNLIDEIAWDKSSSGIWLFNLNTLADGMSVLVTEVVDGDTLKFSFEDKDFTLRLLGVDTPETVHPSKPVEEYGKQASDYLRQLLEGKQVSLKFDARKMDSYGRVLAYVYLNDLFVNAEVIKQGYGYAYTRFPFQFLNDFIAYEAEAKTARRGLWANAEVSAHVEELIEENEVAGEEVFDESVTLFELADVLPEESRNSESELDVNEEKDPSSGVSESSLECDSEFLKIDSFLPYPEKGISEEYIKLINTGSEPVCLLGWLLDDNVEAGSKPFKMTEGELRPGEIKEFGKGLTKISLNNSNDCASLIRPSGELADQICYETSHENEVFTHEGGNWVSKKSSSSVSSTSTKTKKTKSTSTAEAAPKHVFKRESSSYRGELTNNSYAGFVVGFDQEEQVLVLKTPDDNLLPISYAHSLFDVQMIKDLLDLTEEVVLDVYETADSKNLISMHASAPELKSSHSWAYLFPFLLLPGTIGLIYAYKKFRLRTC